MATESVNANASAAGWDTNNAGGQGTPNNNCASTVLSASESDDWEAQLASFSIPAGSTIDLVEGRFNAARSNTEASLYFKFSKDGGATWCSAIHYPGTMPTSSCSSSAWSSYVTCAHSNAPATLTEANTNDLKMRVTGAVGPVGSTVYLDAVEMRITYTTTTVPAAPADPTISATAVKQMSTSQASPDDGGDTLDDVEVQISTSSTFVSGNITWTKGSAPTDPQTHDFTSGDGVVDGTLYYARARYHNSVGWGGYNLTPFNSATSWDVPSTSIDPTLVPNAVGQIQVTKPSSPADNGSAITDWYVEWDNDSGFPSPTGNSGDVVIGTSTYNATSLGNGNQYYFHVRFKNAVGYGSYSAGTVNETTWSVPGVPPNMEVNSV